MNYLDYANRLSRIRIRHRAFEQSYREFYANLCLATEGDVICFVGPSRVGKSTVIRECLQQMFKEHADPRYIPYAKVDASQTNQGCFTLKQLWADLLRELKHPAFAESEYLPRRPQTEAALRSALVQTVRSRRTKAIAVDEAMPMLSMRVRGGPVAALDTLKCLGNETDAAIVICGDYTLLDRCFLSAHLNGRMVVLEFPGYSQSKEDSFEFNRILASVDTILPWRSGESLNKYQDLIYAGTAGCCGSIIKWGRLALAQMGAENRNRLLIRDFERSRREAQAESFHELNERRHILKEMRASMFESPVDPTEPLRPRPRQPGRPGQRSLGRDKVGRVRT